ncbi:MAG: Ig domain-containing protein, partial [Oscillospiraceae bacterium]|nr:Ig domain-containing protein [Oscillospiraceae bacterium]
MMGSTLPAYDGVYAPGSSIEYASGESKDIEFYYCAAGCMSDNEYGPGSTSVKGKGLVVTIDEADKLTFTYYNANGANVTEPNGKTFVETDPVAVTSISLSRNAISIEQGKATFLTAVFEPEDATNQGVTWNSDNESVVRVNSAGQPGSTSGTSALIRAVGSGTATITATSVDGGYTAECTVTVTEATANNDYKVIVVGGVGLSCFESSDVHFESEGKYDYHGLETASRDYDFSTDNSSLYHVLWTLEATGTSDEYYIRSCTGGYLKATYVDNSNGGKTGALFVSEEKVDNCKWYYDGNGLKNQAANRSLAVQSGDNGGRFITVRGTAGSVPSENGLPGLYPGYTIDTRPATGIEMEETLSVDIGRTESLNAKVTPIDADDLTVIWTSNDPDVATVDKYGNVTGAAKGTAVITAAARDTRAGATSAACTVTVNDPYYVIAIGDKALSSESTTDQMNNYNGAYIYSGLAGVDYTEGSTPVSADILWKITPSGEGYLIQSMHGGYLNSVYNASSSPSAETPTTGELFRSDSKEIWLLDGSFESWAGDGTKIHSNNSGKYLTYYDKTLESADQDTEQTDINLFTIGSSNNNRKQTSQITANSSDGITF